MYFYFDGALDSLKCSVVAPNQTFKTLDRVSWQNCAAAGRSQLSRPELLPALRPGPLQQRKLLEKLPPEMHLILKIFRHKGMCFLGLLMEMESWAQLQP